MTHLGARLFIFLLLFRFLFYVFCFRVLFTVLDSTLSLAHSPLIHLPLSGVIRLPAGAESLLGN